MLSDTRIERPPFACEVSVGAISAARASTKAGEVEIVQSRTLPPGAVTPSLLGQNLMQPEVVRDAIREVMTAVAGTPREVVAIIPDAAARVVLLEFDTLPTRQDEAEGVIRFRLKKSLPFDVDKSAVSFQATRTDKQIRVVAAIVLNSVLEEYEAAFRAAGCQPGAVIPSTLAALGAVDASRPTLLLKIDGETNSVAIVNENQLLLHRTQEGNGVLTAERLADDVYPSLVYFQDTFGVTVERVLVSGWKDMAALTPLLAQQTGAQIESMANAINVSGVRPEACGAVGALL
jgi:type IV pilus assembly protein PilM